MKRIVAIFAVLIAFLLTVSACSSPNFSGSGPAYGPASGGSPEIAPAPEGDATSSVVRQVAREAYVSLRVDDVNEAAASIRTLATQSGGWITWEEIYDQSSDTRAYSTITMTVPSSKLEPTLEALAGFGTIESRSIRSNDVTEEVVDVESRIKTMRESIARLNALMEKTGKLSDIAAIEGELTQRQAELESLLARQKWLASQVEMAPIQVTLIPRGVEYSVPNPFVQGIQQGWRAFTESISVMIIAIGALLPFALVAAAIVIPSVRMYRKRRTKWQPHPVVHYNQGTPPNSPTAPEGGPTETPPEKTG